jgi:hypothetical protein
MAVFGAPLLLPHLLPCSHPWYVDVHAIVCVMCEDALTMPTSGQRALVFPHRLQANPAQQMVM